MLQDDRQAWTNWINEEIFRTTGCNDHKLDAAEMQSIIEEAKLSSVQWAVRIFQLAS